MTACSFSVDGGTCSANAAVSFRMLPRRTDTPISLEIKRAIDWPGVESATTVHSCAAHRAAFRAAARVVMAEVALGDAVAVRVVKD